MKKIFLLAVVLMVLTAAPKTKVIDEKTVRPVYLKKGIGH